MSESLPTVDAWLQHPSGDFMRLPMFQSLLRWMGVEDPSDIPDEIPIELTLATMDQGGIDRGMLSAWCLCAHSCRAVLASFDASLGSSAMAPQWRSTNCRATSNPPSMKSAPIVASHAFAKIAGFSAPPDSRSLRDMIRNSPRPIAAATSVKVSRRTRAL